MKKPGRKIRSEHALATIVICISLIYLMPHVTNYGYRSVLSYDYWAHVTYAKQIEKEEGINWDVDAAEPRGFERLRSYPPGFHILLFNIKSITGLPYPEIADFAFVFMIAYVLNIYILSHRILKNKKISVISAFLPLLMMPGSSASFGLFFHPTNLGVILILGTIWASLGTKKTEKIIIMSLLVATIIVSHRPCTFMWFLILPFLALITPVLSKEKKVVFSSYSLPLLISSILAIDFSYIYWNILVERGFFSSQGILYGFSPEIRQMIPENINLAIYGTVFLANIIAFYAFTLTKRDSMTSIPQLKLKDVRICEFWRITALATISVIIVGLLFTPFIYKFISANGLTINPINLILGSWKILAKGTHTSLNALILRQALYPIHVGLLTYLMVLPGLYLILRYTSDVQRNILIAPFIAVACLFILSLMLPSPIKMQRVYLYVYPFAFIVAAVAIYYLLRLKQKHLRIGIIAITFCSLIISTYLIAINEPSISPSQHKYLTYIELNTASGEKILTHLIPVRYGRGLFMSDYIFDKKALFGEPRTVKAQMERTGYKYIVLDDVEFWIEEDVEKRELGRSPLFDKIYSSQTETEDILKNDKKKWILKIGE